MPRTLLTAASILCTASLTASCLAQHSGTSTHADASAAANPHPTIKNLEFLEQYAATNRFRAGQPTAIKIMPDSSAVLFLRSENGRSFKQDLWMFDVASKQEKLLLTADQLLGGKEENLTPEELARRERMRMSSRGIASYQISEDGKQLLIPMSGNLFLVEYASAVGGKPSVLQLTEKGGSIDPQMSADATMVAYVRDGAVMVRETKNTVESTGVHPIDQVVSPAPKNNVTYGEAEFVAQEEMGRSHGFWWSPDSNAIAYQSTDTTGVEIFNIADASDPAKPAQTWPYPRAGTKNADVRLFVQHFGKINTIELSGSGDDVRTIDLLAPIEVRWDHATYPYLAKVTWQKHGPLAILVQNRTQTEQVLYAVDDKTGETRELLREKDEAWINIQDDVPKYLSDGSFLWMTEQGEQAGWTLQRRSADGEIKKSWFASKDSKILNTIVSVSEDGKRFIASKKMHDLADMLWEFEMDGGFQPVSSNVSGRQGVDPRGLQTVTLAIFSKDHSIWVEGETSLFGEPLVRVIRRAPRSSENRADQSSGWLGTLKSVAEKPLISSVKANPLFQPVIQDAAYPEFGWTREEHAMIIRPTNFDSSKKYPVLNFAYTGPGVNTVNANGRAYLLHQWFADQGFIVVTIDGRGTPRRGRAWERAIKNNLIDVALQDQCDALEALCKKYPEMDRNRIGVSGWSFGGYFSAMATMRRPDVFKAGIAGAPVADWRDYDTHYTERYMSLPAPEQEKTDGVPGNQAGYDASSVLTYCKDLTVPLLIIHGTADDNVYFTHSVKMCDALTRAGKKFEFLPLAGQTHMVTQPALVKEINARMVEFFKRELGEPK